MNKSRMLIIFMFFIFLCPLTATAGDYDWMNQFNITAQADPSGFKAQLAARFHIGDATINAVIGNVPQPADAYMIMRLGEMSNLPPEKVLDKFKSNRGKGWGVLAKSLGIKPGSKEFHALKKGQDLYDNEKGNTKGKGKNKTKKNK